MVICNQCLSPLTLCTCVNPTQARCTQYNTQETDRHDITEILLNVALNTLTHNTLAITCCCKRTIHYFLPEIYSLCPSRNNISTFVSRFTFLLLIGLDKFKNRLLRRHQCYLDNGLCASPHLIFLYYTCKKFNQVFY